MMQAEPGAPTVSLLLIASETPASLAAPEAALEVLPVVGPFEALGAAFAEAAARCRGDFVLPVTADFEPAAGFWEGLARAAAANPDADVVRWRLAGLTSDPAWRGRRCRSHLANPESLRFAHLFAPGRIMARREAMTAAAREAAGAGADWWRDLTRRLARGARIAEAEVDARRTQSLPGEPATPGFAPLAPAPRRVLVLGQIEVSTSFYFDFLEERPEVSAAFRPLTRLSVDAPHLAGAHLVILVRELHRFWDEGVIRFLEAAGVPYVYFTDDNFLALRAEGSASRFYNARRMTRALAGAAEVWASTTALAQALRTLHPRVRVWSPALDPVLLRESPAAPPALGKLTVAVAGEDFRLPGLRGPVMERLRMLAAGQGLRLVVTPAGARALAPELPEAEIVAMPRERSFRQFVRQWRRFGVDILLHPAGATANAPYKCPTSAIVAGYLGAAPVAAEEPAYADWGEAEGVIALGPEAEGLALAAMRARDADWRGAMRARLRDALASRLSEAGRLEALTALLVPSASARRQVGPGEPGLLLSRAGLALAKLARPVSDAAGLRG